MSTSNTTAVSDAADGPLSEFGTPPPDPVTLLGQWFDRAVESGVAEPGALSLATVDERGHPSNRIIQVLEVRADGLVFTSHSGSQKGRDLAATGRAAGVWYWRETKQQVIVTGLADRLSDDEADALWMARHPSTYPMSVASVQSEPLDDEEALRAKAQRLADSGRPLPRPGSWVGYLLRPAAIEFWQGRPDRLHRRLRYDRADDGWTSRRLQP